MIYEVNFYFFGSLKHSCKCDFERGEDCPYIKHAMDCKYRCIADKIGKHVNVYISHLIAPSEKTLHPGFFCERCLRCRG